MDKNRVTTAFSLFFKYHQSERSNWPGLRSDHMRLLTFLVLLLFQFYSDVSKEDEESHTN